MSQGQHHQEASEAEVHCTAVTTKRLLSRQRLNCIVADLRRAPTPQLVMIVPVARGMQASPFLWLEARC